MLEDIKKALGDNYREQDDAYLQSLIDDVTKKALNLSNRNDTDENKQILAPYIKKCVIGDYLNRGGEGLNSLSDSGKSSSFKDTHEKMRNNIIKDGLRNLFKCC